MPCAYVFMALFADTLDHLEWKSGIRCDGVAMSIYNVIAVALVGIVTGVFNGLLSNAGYIAPTLDAAGNTVAATQPAAVLDTITFAFVGLEVFTGIILAVLLVFFSVEKTIGRKQAIIKVRQGVDATEEPEPLSKRALAAWQKEMAAGEEYYEKIQKELNSN